MYLYLDACKRVEGSHFQRTVRLQGSTLTWEHLLLEFHSSNSETPGGSNSRTINSNLQGYGLDYWTLRWIFCLDPPRGPGSFSAAAFWRSQPWSESRLLLLCKADRKGWEFLQVGGHFNGFRASDKGCWVDVRQVQS